MQTTSKLLACAVLSLSLVATACSNGGGGGTGGTTGSGGATGTGGGTATTAASSTTTSSGSTTTGVIGMVCNSDLACGPSGPATCADYAYCVAPCQTDADCAPSGSGTAHCVATKHGEKQCFVGCSAPSDCTALNKGLTCRDVGGTKLCTATGDTATPPACQPSGTTSCQTGNDCDCGQACFDFMDSGSGNTYCGFKCSSDADCPGLTGGVLTRCWMGNGVGHCGI